MGLPGLPSSPSSSSPFRSIQQDDEAYQKGRRDGQVRCPLRCYAEEDHQEDGDHPARYLHLHLLRQGLRQAHRCRHLALPRVQEDDRRRRVDRFDHGCCHRPEHRPPSPRARRGLIPSPLPPSRLPFSPSLSPSRQGPVEAGPRAMFRYPGVSTTLCPCPTVAIAAMPPPLAVAGITCARLLTESPSLSHWKKRMRASGLCYIRSVD